MILPVRTLTPLYNTALIAAEEAFAANVWLPALAWLRGPVQLSGNEETPWNDLGAAAIIYALLPPVIRCMFRCRTSSGQAMGWVKG